MRSGLQGSVDVNYLTFILTDYEANLREAAIQAQNEQNSILRVRQKSLPFLLLALRGNEKNTPNIKDGQTLNTVDVNKLIEEMKIAIDQKEQQYNEVDLSKTQHLKQVALEDKMLEYLQREIDELKRAIADLLSKLKAKRQKQAQKAKQSENENKKGILKITVHSVRDLVTYDPEAEKRPYVTLLVLNQIEKTKPKKGATDAEFNEQFEFEYQFDPNQSDSMKIEVWDKDDYASDDKIGGANVNILPFLNNKQDKEVKIQDEYDEPTGIAYLTIEFIPQLQNNKKKRR
ncbi:MAG: hypothetical protein EZS28_001558 [Streblomastix strix]|uniref:C2 domain-containing protein n=1 Tax=Streblomastix strix TaxID=222440 RepID=A0A5J4X6R2_9EUKA|nr:MAG: hypothetical protein EZS28_001558 [Streblomastix strix]